MKNTYNTKHNFTKNFPLAELVQGWKNGKNRAKNIKLADGRKVNIAGYCRINNISMETLKLRKVAK